jgi:ABC-type sugar transport system ATPase subunit
MAMSDWIAVMKDGRVMQWGDPEIYYHPRTTLWPSSWRGNRGQSRLLTAVPQSDGGLARLSSRLQPRRWIHGRSITVHPT